MGMRVAVMMSVIVGMSVSHGSMLYYNITGVHALALSQIRLLAALIARGLLRFTLFKERARGRPGARCTRGLACKMCTRTRTRAYRFSGNTPAFPAQWLYGLCRALPGDEFVLSPSLPA